MDLGIRNKNALVLASSQGLGLGVASKLCEEGANVLLNGRSAGKLAAAADRLTKTGPGCADFAVVDLTDDDAAEQLYAAAREKIGPVHILVNNSGGPPATDSMSPDADLWRRQIDTMLIRIIAISKLCLDDMNAAGWGRILTIASSGVVQPIPNLAMSNTIRSALVGWSKSLSNEVACDNITVNMILPGRIDTERVANLDASAATKLGIPVDEVVAAARASIPMGRYGTVEEFSSVAAFFVSDAARYVTGTLIRCDGGLVKSV